MVHTNIINDDTFKVIDKIVDDKQSKAKYKTAQDYLDDANDELSGRFFALRDFIVSLGEDVQEKKLKNYFGFKRIKNFACVEIHPKTNTVMVYTKANIGEVEFKDGFTRDVTNIGHFGTGNLEIRFTDMKQFEEVQKYVVNSYEAN